MSLMLKLLTATLLLSSLVNADSTSEKVEDFLSNEFGDNPRIKSIDVKVVEEKPLAHVKGWNTYIVAIEAVLKNKPKELIKQKMIWFSNGKVITKELTDLQTSENYTEMVKPNFQKADYSKENLIYGNENAKHKIAIFSDPLCPFCKSFAPKALATMKKSPKKFAVYYYHFPIVRIHPASAVIVRAAVAAEHKGVKDVILNMYNIKVSPREKDVAKILKAFNIATGANITQKDISAKSVIAQIKHDDEIAKNVFVSGTPAIYVDGKIDKTRKLYEKIQ